MNFASQAVLQVGSMFIGLTAFVYTVVKGLLQMSCMVWHECPLLQPYRQQYAALSTPDTGTVPAVSIIGIYVSFMYRLCMKPFFRLLQKDHMHVSTIVLDWLDCLNI